MFPFFDIKKDGNANIDRWSYIFASVAMIGAVLNHFFTFECEGLSRIQASNKIRGVTNKVSPLKKVEEDGIVK